MKILKTLVLALCLALSFSNYSNGQLISVNGNIGATIQQNSSVDVTGNLINQSSWDGCATYLRTRIWGGYSGGPCPNVGLDGTGINFSYGQTTLAQTIAINKALQDTGVEINGYNYRWDVKNSNINGQQSGSFDPIALINVKITDTKGVAVVNDTYNYGYHLPGWTTFSGTQIFTNQYVANTLSSVGLSVTSKDSGYWAGYYGPEFRNFNLSLNYSAAIVPPSAPSSTPRAVTATYTASTYSAPTSIDTSSVPATSVSVGGVQLSTTGEIAAPDNIPQVLKDTAVVASTSVATAVSSTPASVDSVGKPESNKTGPSASVMNAVKQIQAADRAVQARAVQNANQQIATSSSRAQEQAMAIVDTATAMSSSSSQGGSQASSQSNTVSIMQAPQQAQMQSSQSSSQASFQTAIVAPQVSQQLIQSTMQTQSFEIASVQATGPVGMPMMLFKTPMISSAVVQDTSGQLDYSLNAQPLSTNKNTAINDPIDFRLLLDTNISEVRTDSVNRNAQINDLAGGVDIASIATQPKGYEVYGLLTIKDAGFYAPRDIYGNQINVDNARALRQLGNDRLHREMVDQQFRR